MKTKRWLGTWAGLLLAVLLGGCGSGGGDGAGTAGGGETADCTDCGELLVALTDLDGDFLSYVVDVESLSLTRRDGTRVDVLPQSTRLDFTQYTELSELVAAVSVPAGFYVGGTITLDFSAAQIEVERGGEAVAAEVVDAEGAPVTTLELALRLDDDAPLRVAPGTPALLTLDFDLGLSNRVDLSVDPPRVTVEPFLVADVAAVEDKTFRLRGPLAEVAVEEGYYRLGLRPGHRRDGDFGRLRVYTEAETVFEIDGVSYTGEDGLRALAEKPAGTATVAFGRWARTARRFLAAEVYAGSSVPGGEADVVHGTVLARTGDTVVVAGSSLLRRDGRVDYRRDLQVVLSAETRVFRAGAAGSPLEAAAVSVGSRITAFGSLSETDGDLSLAADAVRIVPSHVDGVVTQVQDGQVNLDLQRINGRPVGAYDFGGTGGAPEQDADPANYEVVLPAALTPADVAVDDPVRVTGFVTDFGAAPPDFEALSVADYGEARAVFFAEWAAGTDAAFAALDETGLVFDPSALAAADCLGLRRGPVFSDDAAALGTLAPAAVGLWAIKDDGGVSVWSDFGAFVTALAERLDGTRRLLRLRAMGRYEAADGRLEARLIGVQLGD
ncbi:MAG: hypothetical protein KatS3mg121_0809 [Gammaproteobacteria bacterium]|nr:MAG: hypothetical protein KatS3mg121_0809 [Gammaproteobacteria bacterium]